MSKVKFIQITAKDVSDYSDKLGKSLRDYPGAIIFVANNGAGQQEIWANGLQYKVGGGGTVLYGLIDPPAFGKEYSVVVPNEAPNRADYPSGTEGDTQYNNALVAYQTALDQEAFNSIVPSATEGTVYIKRGSADQNLSDATAYILIKSISGTDNSGNDIVTFTWEAFTGNVMAENVWFNGAVRRNQAWGTQSAEVSSKIDFEERKNLIDYLKFYLLKSGAVPTPNVDYHTTAAPELTVSSSHKITGLKVSSASKTYSAGQEYWVEAGTKVTLAKGTDVTYSLFAVSANQSNKEMTQGGIEVSAMPHGFWLSESDAKSLDADKKVTTAAGLIATSTWGESTTNTFTVRPQTSYGTCTLSLASSNLIYNRPSGQIDSASVTASSTVDSVSLPVTIDREFTVIDKKTGEISITGINGNKRIADVSAYTIPEVTVFVSNNETDAYRKYTYNKSEGSKVQEALPANTTSTITLKGYYPIFSNINSSSYSATTTEINNATKSDYRWSKSTKWAQGAGNAPVIIEYPQTYTLSLTLGGESQSVPSDYVTRTTTTKTVGGNSVPYYKVSINKAFGAGQSVVFSLS